MRALPHAPKVTPQIHLSNRICRFRHSQQFQTSGGNPLMDHAQEPCAHRHPPPQARPVLTRPRFTTRSCTLIDVFDVEKLYHKHAIHTVTLCPHLSHDGSQGLPMSTSVFFFSEASPLTALSFSSNSSNTSNMSAKIWSSYVSSSHSGHTGVSFVSRRVLLSQLVKVVTSCLMYETWRGWELKAVASPRSASCAHLEVQREQIRPKRLSQRENLDPLSTNAGASSWKRPPSVP